MANVSSNNLTTLYSGSGVSIRPTSAYGNSNVVALLNSGTDGGNTVTNIVATGNMLIGNITANGNVTADYFIGNVTGNASNANYSNYANYANFAGEAFDVNVANVTGIGNIAVINLDGNVSNILHGNGYWGPESGNLNANYANFAGNVTISAQPNITSLGTLTTLGVNGTVTAVNFTANTGVFTGNGSGLSNIAGANVTGTVANATFATTAGTVTTNAQPNITSLGTLTSLDVSGNISSGNANLGNLAIANFFSGDGSLLSNVNGSNVSNVANANFANFAGTLINGTSNVSIPVANGNIEFSTAGNANVVTIDTNGVLNAQNSLYVQNGSNVQVTVRGLDNANGGAQPIISFRASSGNLTNPQPLTTPYGSQLYALSGSSWNGSDWAYGGGHYVRYLGEPATPSWFVYGEPAFSYVQNSGPNGNSAFYFENHTGGSMFVGANDIEGGFAIFPYDYSFNIQLDSSGSNFQTFTMASNGNMYIANSYNGSGANITGNILAGNINGGNLVSANYLSGDGYLISNLVITSGTQIVNGNTVVAALPNANVTFDVAGVSNVVVVSDTDTTFIGNVYANSGTVKGLYLEGTLTTNAQPNITSLGNLVSLTINNSNVTLPTKQFDPNGITVGTTANTNLMANSSFVDVDYGNGQGDGNLILSKAQTYVKARGNATTIATAAANDRIGRTNYMVYNGTSNVLAVATFAIPTVINSNANAVTTGGQFNIYTGNPNGDQGNANALSSLNVYNFGPGGTLAITSGAATGSGSYASFSGYGVTAGGNGVQSQGINFARYRGNRDSNLSVQAGDQLGSFGFIGYNGSSLYTARTASLQGVVDSAYVTNASVITSGFKLTSVGSSSQNDNWFYSNANVRLGLTGGSNTTFQSGATLFVNNLDATSNANVTGNLNVTANANITGNLNVTTTSNVANTQLNRFQETVYSIGSTSGTITPDFNNGSIQSMTLTGSITMNSLANAVAGRSMTLIVTQGGSGSYTLTSSMLFSSGFKTLSTLVGAVDIISVFYDGTSYYASLTTGYA